MTGTGTSVAAPDARTDRYVAAAAWTGAVLAAAALIALTGYASRDPDSTVYAGIAARLSTEPLASWIAPEWWGQWGFQGPFREHPVGILLLPAALGRLGYPAPQAAYAVSAGFQALSLVLAGALAAAIVSKREARALTWMLQLILIAFVFRIRANQEYAVLAGLLAALYATERSRVRPAWAAVAAVAFAWVLLVKGIFGLMVPAFCALWLLARARTGQSEPSVRPRRAWLALAATLVVLPALAIGYEALYQRVTGQSFLAFYGGPRLDAAAVLDDVWLRWPENVVWYCGRLIWYALPWSPFAIAACAIRVMRRGGATRSASFDGLRFALLASALLIAAFAAADRRADRFIFPAYYVFGAAGAVLATRWSPRLARVVDRLDRPWVPAAFWMALFLLRLASGPYLPRLMMR